MRRGPHTTLVICSTCAGVIRCSTCDRVIRPPRALLPPDDRRYCTCAAAACSLLTAGSTLGVLPPAARAVSSICSRGRKASFNELLFYGFQNYHASSVDLI